MTDTTRDAFETECRRYWGERCPDLEFKDYKYEGGRAEIAYAFWQAATLTERERAASKVDLTTLRKRTLYGMQNGEAVKECELATAIRSGK